MHEGSWGAEGTNHVWMNPDTSWTYTHIYPAELYAREVCTAGKWKDGGLGERIVKQLCRELLLLESSDWQFLITTGAARDYAELRFETHNDQFNEVKAIWQHFEETGSITPEQETRLAAIELRDSVFLDIDPSYWATGARQIRDGGRNPEDGIPQIINARGDKAPHTPVPDATRLRGPEVHLQHAALMARPSPLALWHLLSLDAPTVAALWTVFIARSVGLNAALDRTGSHVPRRLDDLRRRPLAGLPHPPVWSLADWNTGN